MPLEMLPLSRPEFMGMHPLVPEDQAEGYRELINNLSEDLKIITGFFAGVEFCSQIRELPENIQAFDGLIRAYLESIGQGHRNGILIHFSAHGTNPASAMPGRVYFACCACGSEQEM